MKRLNQGIMTTLFEQTEYAKGERPLAERMRPEKLNDFLGQEHILGERKLLRSIIESDKLTSIILWGPPGTGKTTLARIIAANTKSYFTQFSAVTSGKDDLKKAVREAKDRKAIGQKTILFVDEFHRFNKAQQDAFLPYVENGTIVLIGATTENPGFEINNALLSRSHLFRLNPLSEDDLDKIIDRALKDKEKGLGELGLKIDKKTKEKLTSLANGDARFVLNVLEIIAANKNKGGKISLQEMEEACEKKILSYDKAADEHYDTVSAFIKSMRGSDPDAAVFWLAKMIQGGEDIRFIARRMLISASEDIGNADPHALILASSCAYACDFVGFPEAELILSQTALYLATAPKSNTSKEAINRATADVKSGKSLDVPIHLRNPVTGLAKKLDHGKDYKYPHSFKDAYVKQSYLPKGTLGTYYIPSNRGYEKIIAERLKQWKEKK